MKIEKMRRSRSVLRFLEGWILVGIILGFAITVVGYSDGSDIPIRIDEADGFGRFRNRNLIWILPVASLLLYLFTTFVSYVPRLLNRPIVHDERRDRNYFRAQVLLAVVKLFGTLIIDILIVEIIWYPEWLSFSILLIVGFLLALLLIGFILYWVFGH